MYWDQLNFEEINQKVSKALAQNHNYRREPVLGLPATYLDEDVFYADAPFLKDAPFMRALIDNPNHIGCHTMGESEPAFKGTHELEREVIRICAAEIFNAEADNYDGFVSAGGTEANLMAVWIYRNYFIRESNVDAHKIGLICSEDSHYSVFKAADVLNVKLFQVKVDPTTRKMREDALDEILASTSQQGIKHMIVLLNMGTTMFGSIDESESIISKLQKKDFIFRIHIDAAFGGFVNPFSEKVNTMNLSHPQISSVTLDAHKMLQAPYGTGIFICNKGLMQFASTPEAAYVKGGDFTLNGSRSGANVVAVWMILHTHGSAGWLYKIRLLLDRTSRLCSALASLNIRYFRDPRMNIITIPAYQISENVAHKFHLVPDKHDDPNWYKIVVMPHVSQGIIDRFLADLISSKAAEPR